MPSPYLKLVFCSLAIATNSQLNAAALKSVDVFNAEATSFDELYTETIAEHNPDIAHWAGDHWKAAEAIRGQRTLDIERCYRYPLAAAVSRDHIVAQDRRHRYCILVLQKEMPYKRGYYLEAHMSRTITESLRTQALGYATTTMSSRDGKHMDVWEDVIGLMVANSRLFAAQEIRRNCIDSTVNAIRNKIEAMGPDANNEFKEILFYSPLPTEASQ